MAQSEIQIPQLMQLLYDISKDRPLSAKDFAGTPNSQNRSHIPQAIQRSFRLATPNVRIDFGLALWKKFISPTPSVIFARPRGFEPGRARSQETRCSLARNRPLYGRGRRSGYSPPHQAVSQHEREAWFAGTGLRVRLDGGTVGNTWLHASRKNGERL